MKKLTAIVLVIILGMTTLLACGKEENGSGKGKDTAAKTQTKSEKEKTGTDGLEKMGRYVEKDVALPDIFDNTKPFILQGKGKAVELYAMKEDGQNACTYYQFGEEGKWKKGTAPFQFTIQDKEEYGSIESITYGSDQNYYAVVRKGEAPVLLQLQEKQSPKIIPMEGWDQPSMVGDMEYYQYPSVTVLESGYIISAESAVGTTLFHSKGKKIENLSKDSLQICGWGENIAYFDHQKSSIQVVSKTDGSNLQTLKLEENTDGRMAIQAGPDGNLYLANAQGLHRILEGGSKWETLMDGELLSFAVPSLYFISIQFGENQDYFIDYQNDEGKHTYMHYVFDESISAVPHQTLTIYSLKESKSIRTAAVAFQRNNPDVKVDYRAPMSNNSAAELSDCIQALNAELLAKKGADILICDQLPSDSYMEKGILQDLSDVIDPMVQQGDLLENVVRASKKDGKLYVLPARIAPILLIGRQEAIANAGSLADLAAYAKGQMGKTSLFADQSCGQLASTLFAFWQSQLVQEDGSLNKDKMVEFLEQVKQISEQSGLTAEEAEQDENYNKQEYNLMSGLIDNTSQMGILSEGSLDGMMGIMAMKKQGIATYQLAFEAYEPKVQMAVTAASQQKELAYQFIAAMLEEDLQRESFDQGVPIQTGAIKQWNSIVKYVKSSTTTKQNNDFVMDWPAAKQIQEWTNLFAKTERPVTLTGSVYQEAIAEQFTAMMEGRLDSSACVDAIQNQIKTYLNE